MSKTYPSRLLCVLDLSEPTGLQVKFQYNYFTSNERTSTLNDSFLITNADRTAKLEGRRDLPRWVKVAWKPVPISKVNPVGTDRLRRGAALNPQTVGLVQSEETFSNFDFVGFNFQDLNIESKIIDLIAGSLSLNPAGGTSTSKAALLNQSTGVLVDPRNILLGIDSVDKQGLIVSPDILSSIEAVKRIDIASRVKVRMQVNSKVVGTIVKNSSQDSLNFYADEMVQLTTAADALQTNTIQRKDSHLVSSTEWDTGFVPIVTQPIDDDDSSQLSSASCVGYIVSREELDTSGQIVSTKTIVTVGANSSAIVDVDIKYGVAYRYDVRSVFLVSLVGTEDTGRVVLMKGLVSSQPTSKVSVNCIELKAPPPPGDIKATWDYDLGKLRLIWSFPVNSQRDIKKFQVFRRENTSQAFQLLQVYDFDDSDVLTNSGETYSEDRVLTMTDPSTVYIDDRFTKDSTFIYALCSVDAHGLSSGYSMQIKVSFDRFSNRVICKEASRSGAPKAYPNLYLSEDTLVDTVRTSGYQKMKVYFDPEHYVVQDEVGQDLDFLPANDPNGGYKILLVNVDRQQSAQLDIKLADRRTDEDTLGSQGSATPKATVDIAVFSGLKGQT